MRARSPKRHSTPASSSTRWPTCTHSPASTRFRRGRRSFFPLKTKTSTRARSAISRHAAEVDGPDLGRGRPIELGASAPDFTVTMVGTGQSVSLAEYLGKSPLLLGLYRGLYCPFCRRAVVTLGLVGDRLRALGIETLAVIGTTLDNA